MPMSLGLGWGVSEFQKVAYGGGAEEGREGKGKRCALLPELHSPHLDEVLRDLGDPLLALVDREVGPVLQLLVDLSSIESTSRTIPSSGHTHLLKRLRVVIRQLYSLPHVRRTMCALDRLHEEV